MIIMLIQVLRWLIGPKARRLMCFASSAVGLLFYALSSSFNHLFGKWTWWKLSLYTVFSFIICLAVLFAKAWQPLTTLRLKAHLAFLVLIITSIYSFFWDKVVKGKPDAYSLVSSAAFAFMSLGLSRQAHCGFEIDLLYFFSGCLIMQLMKIKLWLGTVGVSFSYFLVILRSILDPPPHLVGSSLDAVHVQDDHIVIQVRSDSQDIHINSGSTVPVDSSEATIDTNNANLIMQQQANSNIDSALEAPPENEDLGSRNHAITHSDIGLIQPQFMACIKALKKKNLKLFRIVSRHVDEFLQLQNMRHELVPPPQPDVNLVMDSLPSRVINNLHETVKLMVAAGFEKECCRVYSSCRREFIQKCLSRFGLHDLNMEDVDSKMIGETENWISASTVALRILFPNERRLCDRIFGGFSSAADISFMQVCRYFTIPLLKFANNVATGNHSPHVFLRIFPEVFETLNSLLPTFESLFSDQYSVSLRNEAHEVWETLREANGGIFMKMENLACHDMMHEALPWRGVDPITRDVIECFRRLNNLMEIVGNQVFTEFSMARDTEGNSPSIDDQWAQIMDLLENKLEAKSKSYTNPALGCVFMINNLRYIANRYTRGILSINDWRKKYMEKSQQSLKLYQRSSWNKVLDLLKLDNNESEEPNVVAELMKDKLNLFNMHFDEICRVQSKWHVVDNQVKEELVKSIEDILLPIYGEFIGRFQDVLGNHAYEYIKYGMFDIQDRLNHLFVFWPIAMKDWWP